LLKRYATDDAVTQRLDDLTGFDHGADVDAVNRAAVVLGDDNVLGNVNQTTGEVAGVGSLECGIRQSLTGAVGGDEVLQHGESLTEVGGDGRLNDLARGLGHQSAHTGELTDLLFRSASAGVSHDVNGVELAGFVFVLEHAEHLVGHFFGDAG